MKLSEYLKVHPETNLSRFASIIGVSRPFLYKILHEESEPTASVCIKIEEITHGLVTLKDLIIGKKKVSEKYKKVKDDKESKEVSKTRRKK